MQKLLCLKWPYWLSGIDYRVASIGYLTSKGIVLEINTKNNEKSYSLRTDTNYRKVPPLKTNKTTNNFLTLYFLFTLEYIT